MSKPKTSKDLGELLPQEVELIYLIRTVYRFGEVTIMTREGVPQDIVKTVVRLRLGNLSPDDVDAAQKQFYNSSSK